VPGYSYSGSELAESSTGMVSIKSVERSGGFKSDGIKPLRPLKQIPPSKMCTTGDVLVAHTDLTKNQDIIGSPIIITTKSNFKQLTYSMDLVKVVSNTASVGNALLFRILDSSEFKAHALGFCSGTTVVHLSRKALETFEFDGPQKGVNELSDRLDVIEKHKAETTRRIEVLQSIKTILLSKYFD
jgi:type I restriction enzyme S subunit